VEDKIHFLAPNIENYPSNVETCYGTNMDEPVLESTFGPEFKDAMNMLYPEECFKKMKAGEIADARILSRGHLTANNDFVYGFQKLATFYYSNAAPQWKITNGGNFNNVEDFVRTIVSTNRAPYEVYSGTHGTMQVKSTDNFHGPCFCCPVEN